MKLTEKSSLVTGGTFDHALSRLRERAEESGYDVGEGLCLNCDAQLTEVDVDLGECSQCHSAIDVNDESVEEHLYDD